ncbi:MAG TPA: hypothetical protein VGR62_20335 [Candidatus Binatia bacterium]|jgi:hypothetical protein|nr:hypothetical protein [Candidatus Binatia bacterium]
MRALRVALGFVVGLASPAAALVTFETVTGYNLTGLGSTFDQDGGDPPVMSGNDGEFFTFDGPGCPPPTGPTYACARRFGSAGMTNGRLWLKSAARLVLDDVVGFGNGSSDYLVYADTTINIYNLGGVVETPTALVYFVFGLHGTAATSPHSAEVQTQATGTANLSSIGIQCTGDPCPPIVVKWPTPVTFGNNNFRLNLRADARAGANVGVPYDVEMLANFGDTLELLAIQIHDENDVPIPGAQAYLTDTNGDPMPPYPNTYETTTTSTTSTTLEGGTTTTTSTTLPGGQCESGPTYGGLKCRVIRLAVFVGNDAGLGKLAKPFVTQLNKAIAYLSAAEDATSARRRAKMLRKSTAGMNAFRKKVASKRAVRKIAPGLRATMEAPVAGILADMAALSSP